MEDQEAPVYTLPSSPLSRCLDRLGIVEDAFEDEDGLIPAWSVLEILLRKPVSSPEQLVDLLETISITFRGTTGFAEDYGFLKQFLEKRWCKKAFEAHWPNIASIALDMPSLFDGFSYTLAIGGPENPLRLTRRHVACLVVHQFLCTLEPPPFRSYNDYIDFSIWYGLEQRHPKASKMYLTALFMFLEGLGTEEPSGSSAKDEVIYALHENKTFDPARSECSTPLMEPKVVFVDQYDNSTQRADVQGPSGAVVVSANRVVGFGKSATQEEIYVGLSPEACPAVLVTPPLTDTTVLTISGARALIQATGQRRDITWKVPDCTSRDSCDLSMSLNGGNMILMDALELDEEDQDDGPDLKPENIDRDIRKAFIGFSAGEYDAIWTGPWGCGAFGGDAAIKFVILWLAASWARVSELKIVCDASHRRLGSIFEAFVETAKGISTEELRELLTQVPRHKKAADALNWMAEHIVANPLASGSITKGP